MGIKWGRNSTGLHPKLQTYKNYIMKANMKCYNSLLNKILLFSFSVSFLSA
jgi:hypothetical protein